MSLILPIDPKFKWVKTTCYKVSRKRPLDARDLDIKSMFLNGCTMQEIATKYGISRERVRQRLAVMGLRRMDGGMTMRQLKKVEDFVKHLEEKKRRRENRDFQKWGMPIEAINSLSTHPRSSKHHPITKFIQQRKNARIRGIAWDLSFADWWRIWQESGKWEERGTGQGYVMSRWGDDGPYSAENVYICTSVQNIKDSFITKPMNGRVRKRVLNAKGIK